MSDYGIECELGGMTLYEIDNSKSGMFIDGSTCVFVKSIDRHHVSYTNNSSIIDLSTPILKIYLFDNV